MTTVHAHQDRTRRCTALHEVSHIACELIASKVATNFGARVGEACSAGLIDIATLFGDDDQQNHPLKNLIVSLSEPGEMRKTPVYGWRRSKIKNIARPIDTAARASAMIIAALFGANRP